MPATDALGGVLVEGAPELKNAYRSEEHSHSRTALTSTPPEAPSGPQARRGDRASATLQRVWNENAQADPFFSVLGDERHRHGPWDPDAFFETGRREVQALFDRLSADGLSPRFGRALDFGCGLGRLAEALAERYSRVAAVDISDSMVEQARRLTKHRNVEYITNVAPDLRLFASGSFDLCVSHLVLQHTGRRLAMNYLSEVIRILAPGGIAEVQVPVGFGGLLGWLAAFLPDRVLSLQRLRWHGIFFTTTFPIRERRVHRIIVAGGGKVIESVVEKVNPAAIVRSFVFVKASAT
jgi:SAM-dependent methyltransferase